MIRNPDRSRSSALATIRAVSSPRPYLFVTRRAKRVASCMCRPVRGNECAGAYSCPLPDLTGPQRWTVVSVTRWLGSRSLFGPCAPDRAVHHPWAVKCTTKYLYQHSRSASPRFSAKSEMRIRGTNSLSAVRIRDMQFHHLMFSKAIARRRFRTACSCNLCSG